MNKIAKLAALGAGAALVVSYLIYGIYKGDVVRTRAALEGANQCYAEGNLKGAKNVLNAYNNDYINDFNFVELLNTKDFKEINKLEKKLGMK
jgi:hypothetical protein